MAEKESDYFCRNVQYLRKTHQYSQHKMAEIMGISVKSLRKVENGSIPRCITARTVYLLCWHFQISSDSVVFQILEKENSR